MFSYTGDGAKNCVVTKTFEDFSTKEVAAEYNLPDYLPDISRILYTGAHICRAGKYINGTALEYDGSIVFTVVYCTADGIMKNVEIPSDYSGSMPVADYSGDCSVNAETTLEGVSARLQNPRKLTVKAKVRVSVDIYSAECTSPAITGKLTEEELGNIQYKNEMIDCACRLAAADAENRVSDDIEIPTGLPQIGELVSVSFFPCMHELKAENGFVSYKGTVLAKVLYSAMPEKESDTVKYFCHTKKIPVSGEVPAEEVTENCFCTGNICITSAEYRAVPSTSGETRTVEADITCGIFIDAYCNTKSEITTDMYSVDYESATESKKLGYRTALTSKSFETTQSAYAELSDADFSSIVCVCAKAAVTGAEKVGGKTVFSGVNEISAILSNGAGVYLGKTFSSPFKAETDAGFVPDGFGFAAYADVCDVSGRVDGGKLCAEVEVCINFVLFASKDAVYASSLAVNHDRVREHAVGASITMYYPSKSDTVWDIAKKYGIPRDELSALNGISGDLPGGDVLIIPKKSAKKPIYTKIL